MIWMYIKRGNRWNQIRPKNLFFEYSIFRLHAQVCFCVKSVCLRLGFCMSLVRQKQPRIVQFKRLKTCQTGLWWFDDVVWFGTFAVRGVVHLQAAATKCAVCQTRNVLLGDLFAVGWAAPQAFRVCMIIMICRNGCWYIAYTHANATLGKYITTMIMFLTVFVQFGGIDNCSPVRAMRFPRSKRIAWRHDGLGHGLKKNRKIL